MFDNPKRELQRLQQKLLDAEEPEWEPEEEEEDEDPDAALEEMKKLLEADAWDEAYREPLYRSYVDEDEDEDLYLDPEDDEEKAAPPKKKENIRGLLVALILETFALVGVLLWWFLW